MVSKTIPLDLNSFPFISFFNLLQLIYMAVQNTVKYNIIISLTFFLSQIVKRGAPPEGGGEVVFSCPVRRNLRPLQFTDPGKIKRIRGLAYPLLFPLV